MSDAPPDPIFSELRPRLVRLAYRMLGSVADAEDIVQNAWLRWRGSDHAAVREPAAFLRTIVTRLCLNELKSARRRRESYVGSWLPEPIFDPEEDDAADDITMPLMLALERLSPLERAAFLLHDVFGMDFDEVSSAIGREAATCRKLASRARAHITEARPRFAVGREQGLKLATAFFMASRTGDMASLRALLSEDIVVYADGGGKVPTSQRPHIGLSAVMLLHEQLARIFRAQPSRLIHYAVIDGLPGFVTIEGGNVVQTTALQIEQDKVVAIYCTRNPDKLQHIIGTIPD
ncbi:MULTISPECIES: sigma-70 family RNA polymerase sigma factor [unclassified Rhizobium]|jgi:RNA polymerase sigma factor (sigma-70 family)|uniref:sigma-70 family RNA polymerase sigma factor n=1 Tax=unclassified Rhizobium TaxID=2613769 RepID=UPI00064616D0|nr:MULTISPECIES: sigma-70 family RNA polymerase sigma factor [unclassified Rhizobium]MBN8952017.1 sigma-70 family RNA polymerase sigma factor [Rhizobium tropici]OJY78027.1 MAG: RNA polymerase sigma factor SigJ [Rhizobium sp. 60-20]RKD56652.1 RNA polymerase sigma-70 factor (ECF subfamily) [Rhizobium sp. WW_1]